VIVVLYLTPTNHSGNKPSVLNNKVGGKTVSSTRSKFSRFKYKKDSDMSLQDKAKAAAKNVEGKVQEAAGDLTDNHEAQAKGKAKQAQAKVSQKVEDVKDGAKEIID
jgi:uncharacterized protein YjbJ (UPF0337 family)